MDAHQQMDRAAVAVRSDGLEDHGGGASILDGDIGGQWASVAKQAILNQHAVIEQMVVIAASREDLAQRTYLGGAFSGLDALGSALLQQGHRTHGDDGEQAQHRGVLQHRTADFRNYHVIRPA